VGTLDAVIRHDRSVPLPKHGAAAVIRRVTQGESLLFGGSALSAAAAAQLPHSRTAIRFDFGAAAYDRGQANRYQSMLAGYERAWSPWTEESAREYTNLPPGSTPSGCAHETPMASSDRRRPIASSF
jgi:hypothetical protein